MDTMIESSRRNSTTDRLKPAPVYTQPVTFHYEIQNHTTRMQRLTKAFSVYRLMVLTLICVLAGILAGLVCRPLAHNWTERHFMYIEFPGELYLRFLRLMIIPLLVSNVILSFGTIQGKVSSRLGMAAGALYLACNLIAVTVAIICAVCINPGGSYRRLEATSPRAAFGAQTSGLAGEQQQQQHHLLLHYRSVDSIMARHADNYAPPMFQSAARNQADELKEGAYFNAPLGAKSSAHEDRPRPPLSVRRRKPPDDRGERERNHEGPPLLLAELKRPQSDSSKQPEREANSNNKSVGLSTKLPIDVVLDALRNLVPDSLVGAALQQTRTRLFTPKELRVSRNGTTEPAPSNWPMGHETVDQPNIIGLLAMSVLTGVVLSHMGEASKPLLDLCSCVSELSLRVGMKAIHLAPFCIMFLLIGQVARARDLSCIVGELLMYSLTVVLALLIHAFLILPLLYYFITKRSPFHFLKGMLEALVASFATSSSSSTMALMLNCLTSLNLNLVIVRAFGPLGSVFNMNGTSIFEAIAVIFIAQTLGVCLPLTSLLLVGFCSAIASLSTSGIPSSGMMTMVIVLNAINLPVLELSLIYIVDFIIDRFRTVVNVWSGAVVCGIINHVCPEELFEDEMKPEKYREMVKYRASRASLGGRKNSAAVEEKPQVISVTITPPDESSRI